MKHMTLKEVHKDELEACEWYTVFFDDEDTPVLREAMWSEEDELFIPRDDNEDCRTARWGMHVDIAEIIFELPTRDKIKG